MEKKLCLQNCNGLVTLEVGIFTFATLMFLVLPAVKIIDAVQASDRVERIVNSIALDSGFTPLNFHTGDQDFVVGLKRKPLGNPARPGYNDRAREFKRAVSALVDAMSIEAERVLGCETSCRNRYRVEVRHASIKINTATGQVTLDHNRDETKSGDGFQEGIRGFKGGFNVTKGKGTEYFQKRGTLSGRDQFLFEQMKDFISAGSAGPFVFAIPSGMHGALQQQNYGQSHLRTRTGQFEPISYLRTAVLFGIAVHVDFDGTFTGFLLRQLRKKNELPNQDAVISKVRLMTTRQEF